MKNRTLIATGFSVLLAASLYAHGGSGMGYGMMMNNDDDQQVRSNQPIRHSGNGMNYGYGMMNGNYPGMMMGQGGYGMMNGNYPNMMQNGYGMMGQGMMNGGYPGMMMGQGGYGMMNGNYPNMMGYGMMNGNHHFGHGGSVMQMFYGLNLTREQMEKISKIQLEMYKNLQKPDSAFTKNSFNKDKYVEIMKKRRDDFIKMKAEAISKIYEILDSKQKENLKKMMDFIHSRGF